MFKQGTGNRFEVIVEYIGAAVVCVSVMGWISDLVVL